MGGIRWLVGDPVFPGRGCIQFSRVAHVECLVWALVIVNGQAVLEATVLLQEVIGNRPGWPAFQCQVQALMAAILSGMSRFYPFNLDTQEKPPDREPAQNKQGIGRSKGDAVIGTNGLWQAVWRSGSHEAAFSESWGPPAGGLALENGNGLFFAMSSAAVV